MQKLKNTTTSFIIFAVLFSAFFPVLGSTKVSATGNSTLSLEKLVKKEADTIYVSQINANFGETVDFKLKVTNTGDMTLSDLNVSDVLPVNLTFLSGSLVVAAPTYGGELFSSDGLNIHDLAVGESQEITFKATVAANDQFGVGETILTNTATAVEKGSTSSSPDAKTASVKVTKNVDGGDPLPPPSGGGGSTCTHKVPTGYVHGANATLNVPDGACPVKVSFSSYSHAGTIQPFDAQVLIENITQTYGPGTYNVGPIKLECNWQTDLYLGEVQYPLSAGGHTGLIDADYVEHQNCNPTQTNTPPTITLIGANPLNITIGTQFTDPGATATDTEDGDLTSQIVKTGTVNASTTGTYTLTYVV
ncbi:MAG: immunoglobulin-like domain-containing protein, partial [Candidatus Paceibacterota bacterium]